MKRRTLLQSIAALCALPVFPVFAAKKVDCSPVEPAYIVKGYDLWYDRDGLVPFRVWNPVTREPRDVWIDMQLSASIRDKNTLVGYVGKEDVDFLRHLPYPNNFPEDDNSYAFAPVCCYATMQILWDDEIGMLTNNGSGIRLRVKT